MQSRRTQEDRRDAWRIGHHGPGWLAAPGFRANCRVDDISVTGARVRVARARLGRAMPRGLTLTVMVGGEKVTVAATVTRVARIAGDGSGLELALSFADGDAVGLGWLINQAQRQAIAARPPGHRSA